VRRIESDGSELFPVPDVGLLGQNLVQRDFALYIPVISKNVYFISPKGYSPP
jgi:hypothetical protein